MKSVDKIRDEYYDNDCQLSRQSIEDLKWHLENDDDPQKAISLTIDTKLKDLVPLMAKHLDHEDWFIRELTIGGILEGLYLPEYAEKGLDMAQNDQDESVRNIAVFTLWAVINKVPSALSQRIASHILETFQYHEDKIDRDSAYLSILKAMEAPWEKRPRVSKGVSESDIDPAILDAFCKKYQVNIDKYTT